MSLHWFEILYLSGISIDCWLYYPILVQSLKRQPNKSISLSQPDDDIYIPPRDPNEQINSSPQIEESEGQNQHSQRPSSHVTSHDSGLEEDNGMTTEPATRPESSRSDQGDKTSNEQNGILTPDNQRSHVFEENETAVTEILREEFTKENDKNASAIVSTNESAIEISDATEEEVLQLGGTIETEETDISNNLNETYDLTERVKKESLIENQDIPDDAGITNENNPNEIPNAGLVIEGTALETSGKKEEAKSPNTESESFAEPRKITSASISRPNTSGKRPMSAQSRVQSAFKRPDSTNSAKIAPSFPSAKTFTKPNSRPVSAKSDKIEAIQTADERAKSREGTASRQESAKSTRSLVNMSRQVSANSTRSLVNASWRPSSKTSNNSVKSLPITNNDLQLDSNDGRKSSQSLRSANFGVAPVVKKQTKPGSRNSQATFDVAPKLPPAAELEIDRKTPELTSSRPSSKASEAPKRPESGISQRSNGSEKVPLDIETSNTNITNAERSASSMDDLEMLQHVMEGTLERKNDVTDMSASYVIDGRNDVMDDYNDIIDGETENVEKNYETHEQNEIDDDKADISHEAPNNEVTNAGEKISARELETKSPNGSHVSFDVKNGNKDSLSKENTQNDLEDVEENNFLDTFSTKNLELSMKPNDDDKKPEELENLKAAGNEASSSSPPKTPPEDQEEHINA